MIKGLLIALIIFPALAQAKSKASLSEIAEDELKVQKRNPATVSEGVISLSDIKEPTSHKAPQWSVELAAQRLQHTGQQKLVTGGAFELGSAETSTVILLGIERRYFASRPLKIYGRGQFGAAYDRFRLTQFSDSSNASLWTLVGQLGAGAERALYKDILAARVGLQVGVMSLSTASDLAISNGSQVVQFWGPTAGLRWSFQKPAFVNLEYQFKSRFGSTGSDLGLQSHNILAGVGLFL